MRNSIIRIFLYACIAMVPVSCGSRKVQTQISKTTDSFKDQDSSKGSVSTNSGNSDSNKTTNQADKVNESQEQRITELYNENGGLIKRITELLNTKSTDKSVQTKERLRTHYINTDSVFNNKRTITRTITIKEKTKNTQTDNNALYWALFGLGFLTVVGYFLYKYLTRIPKQVLLPKKEQELYAK